MFPRLSFFLALLSLPLALRASPSIELSSLEEFSEDIENDMETSQDSLFNEEEEFSAVPKKGHRPQVIQIPSKTSAAR